ncbi:MAG: hypothetical protein GY696_14990, partial [Gammaproteobacteria bacterium]|nr:hypothetical protein [Gammaproteobacteria bacterium]
MSQELERSPRLKKLAARTVNEARFPVTPWIAPRVDPRGVDGVHPCGPGLVAEGRDPDMRSLSLYFDVFTPAICRQSEDYDYDVLYYAVLLAFMGEDFTYDTISLEIERIAKVERQYSFYHRTSDKFGLYYAVRQCELYLRKTGIRSAQKKGDQKTNRQAEIDSGSFPRDEVFSQTASVTNARFATSEVNGWSLRRSGGSTIYVNPARATRTDVPPETLYNPAHYLAAAKWNFGCAPTQSVYSYAIFEMARMLGKIAESAA